ncbi:MAG: two-component system, cell cycle sensor histidine kinase and response regulator CckA [Actinomycetota bacterium]|jgi:PAS domain S-box-containing protein|nr:two-component system, cell cycle sensor histidine kinase and response regulator CckA [Actinomycetota bacterium]
MPDSGEVFGMGVADSHWQLIAESVPHILWMASPDGSMEYMNRRAHDYTGWPHGVPFHEMWRAVLHPDDAAGAIGTWQHAIRTGTAFSTEYRIRHADGEFRWHSGRGVPVRDAGGEIVKWIGTATDIDDQKRLESALRETADRLAESQRLAHLGSWSVDDVRTGRRTWSDELYRLFGYEPQEVVADAERVAERLHPDDASRLRAAMALHGTRLESWEDEFRIVLPGGGVRWLAARTEPVLGDAGEVVRVHGTTQDVTERKEADEQLRFQAQLLDAVGEAIIATDMTGAVIYWGPGAEELYGWSAQEAEGRAVMDLISPVRGSYDPDDVMGRLARGERWAGMVELGRRDGSSFTAEVTTRQVLDDAGRMVAIIGTSSDVSVREEAHAELERAHHTAAEALNLLATLQAEAPVGFAFVDRDFRYVRINLELASIIDRPIEQILGRRVAEMVPEMWHKLEPLYRHVLDTGEAVRDRPVIERAGVNSRAREWLASHYPVRVGDEIIGVGVLVHDITERVRAEEFRSAVMSQVTDGVYTQDCEGRLMYMNSAASKMLGWTEFELRGKDMHELVHCHNADGTGGGSADCAFVTEAPHGRLERSAGEAFVRKDGSIFPVAYSAVPLRTGSRVEGVAVVFRDVSEPGSSPNVIRVLIVDDDRATTTSFQALLDRHEGIEVVGVATTSALAVEYARRRGPDVVLVTVDLPDGDGLTTTMSIKFHAPSTKVILMTEKHDDAIAIAGIEAGCAGVLDKSRAWVELVSAVRAAYHGETTISQEELQRVLAKVRSEDASGRSTHLTAREEEVLACLREGLTNAKVAERLGVSPNTVRNHVQRILYKLDVHSKLEAVVATSREGLRRGAG